MSTGLSPPMHNLGAIGQPRSPRLITTYGASTLYSSQPKTPSPHRELAAFAQRSISHEKSLSLSHFADPGVGVIGDRLHTHADRLNLGHRRLDSEPWNAYARRAVKPRPTYQDDTSPPPFGSPEEDPIVVPPHTAPLHRSFTPYHDQQRAAPVSPPLPEGAKHIAMDINGHLQAIAKLAAPLNDAVGEMETLRKEIAAWKGLSNKIEEEKLSMEKQLVSHQAQTALKESDLVVVLIDGNELIFNDVLFQQGAAGGQEAAARLLAAIAPSNSLHSSASDHSLTTLVNDATTDRLVLVHVLIDKRVLGHSLLKTGLLVWSTYEAFWQGLATAKGLISVTDVGPGQDAVPSKITDYLKAYNSRQRCSAIYIGTSANSAHISTFDDCLHGHGTPRLTYIHPLPIEGDQRNVLAVPNVFHTGRRVSIPPPIQSFSAILQQPASAPNKAALAPAMVKIPTNTTSVSSETSLDFASPQSTTKKPRGGRGGRNTGRRSEQSEDGEWTESQRKSVAKGRRSIRRGGIKVDSVRALKPRPCHTYYLSPYGCRTGEDCDYSHEYDLNDSQLDELATLAKEIICPYIKSNKCRYSEDDCVYGHRCPRGKSCNFGETCRFTPLNDAHVE